MKPPFAYYGGKTRFAPWIVENLPAHRVYVEPFAGSAAVLFAKRPARHEVLNDLDGQVINFYRLLRDEPDALELACRLTPYARDEYLSADFDAEDLDDLERARRWWVRSTQGFGQSAHASTGWSISTEQNTPRMNQLTNKLDRFASLAERLRHVFIENLPAVEVLSRFVGDPEACIYLDPPYLGATRSALNQYRYEMASDEAHRALAASVAAAKASVIVSGYASPLYDEDLFAGWDRIARPSPGRAGDGKGRAADKTEVLWANFDLHAGSLFAGGPA